MRKKLPKWLRNATIGADRLWLFAVYTVGFAGLTRAEVRSWSMHKRRIAYRYVRYVFYTASDNVMKRVERPHWWDKEWGSWQNSQRLDRMLSNRAKNSNRSSRSKVG